MRYDWVVPGVHGLRDYLDLPQLPGNRSDFPLQSKKTHSTPLAVTLSLLQGETTGQSPAMRPVEHFPQLTLIGTSQRCLRFGGCLAA